MRNHYIPKFILRQFVNHRGMVYVYDKKTRVIRESLPDHVFVVNKLYDDQIEDLLAQVESWISSILRSALNSSRNNTKLAMPKSDVLECCRYLAVLQLGRTLYAKKLGVEGLGDGLSDEELVSELEEAGFATDGHTLQRARESQDALLDELKGRKTSKAWMRTMLDLMRDPARAYPDVAKAVLDKGVVLVTSDSTFVLGDRGAVSTATPDKPLYHPDSEIYFPVSPDVALSIHGTKDQVVYFNADRAATRRANLSTIQHSDCIVSNSERLLQSLADPR